VTVDDGERATTPSASGDDERQSGDARSRYSFALNAVLSSE
jgi:hypothetical protein